MSYMFKDARSFDQPLTDWDVSNVTDMSYMFLNALAFAGRTARYAPWYFDQDQSVDSQEILTSLSIIGTCPGHRRREHAEGPLRRALVALGGRRRAAVGTAFNSLAPAITGTQSGPGLSSMHRARTRPWLSRA